MASLTPITVLIVDDHEIVRTGLKAALSKIQELSIVGEASDGNGAISQAVKTNAKVILMDIGMPNLDGIAATREIKRRLPGTRVLMLTSHDQEQDIFASLIAGADGYCLKESSPHKIANAITAVTHGAAWLDRDIVGRVLIAAERHAAQTKQQNVVLTQRELEVVKLVGQGLSNAELSQSLIVGKETIKTHIRNIMHKLSVTSRTHIAIEALKRGLI